MHFHWCILRHLELPRKPTNDRPWEVVLRRPQWFQMFVSCECNVVQRFLVASRRKNHTEAKQRLESANSIS
uniref:Secreted protein n=1 Tax=Mesocestoides corti TaxID=53468 RepID=A0A5K3FTP8_MESCO